jgi:hypothetical protein
MSAIASTPIDAEAKNAPTSGRLFFLDLSAGRILSANPDGSDWRHVHTEAAPAGEEERLWADVVELLPGSGCPGRPSLP